MQRSNHQRWASTLQASGKHVANKMDLLGRLLLLQLLPGSCLLPVSP
jgi:hypothetical protein